VRHHVYEQIPGLSSASVQLIQICQAAMSNLMLHWTQSVEARSAAEQCLRDTGAVKACLRCGDEFLSANDESAEARAYSRAEHLRKAGLRGFEGMTAQDVAAAVRAALDGMREVCRNGC
jgi:hypothetical protein